ncbi:hypothetical protein ADUPG1_001618, partial [Aduncisulcus paluster]
DGRKVLRRYRRLSETFKKFEVLWHKQWVTVAHTARQGLQATLLIQDPSNKSDLYVNFDRNVIQLCREAYHMERLGLVVPDAAKSIALHEKILLRHYDALSLLLKERFRVLGKIPELLQPIMKPFTDLLARKVSPGLTTLTWSSLNVDHFLRTLFKLLSQLEETVDAAIDILSVRIKRNIMAISNTCFVYLPSVEKAAEPSTTGVEDEDADVKVEPEVVYSPTIEEFTTLQTKHVSVAAEKVRLLSQRVELATSDLTDMVSSKYSIKANLKAKNAIDDLHEFIHEQIGAAVFLATERSLTAMSFRLPPLIGQRRAVSTSTVTDGTVFVAAPLFRVQVELSVPTIKMHPGWDKIYSAINDTVQSILDVASHIPQWESMDTDIGTARSVVSPHPRTLRSVSPSTATLANARAGVISSCENIHNFTGVISFAHTIVRSRHMLKL